MIIKYYNLGMRWVEIMQTYYRVTVLFIGQWLTLVYQNIFNSCKKLYCSLELSFFSIIVSEGD
jgi:hypothetical protein